MHRFTERVLQRLADRGIRLDMLRALDDVMELDRLARACSEKPMHHRFSELETPIYIKDTAFWPPTLGSMAWARKVGEWFPEDTGLTDLALVFSLANVTALRGLTNPESARATLLAWALERDISVAHAREALALLLPAPRDSREDIELDGLRMANGDDAKTWPETALRQAVQWWLEIQKRNEMLMADNGRSTGSLVTTCMETYGQTFDFWIFEVSLDRLMEAAEGIQARNEAEAAAAAKEGSRSVARWAAAAQGRFNVYARGFEQKWGGGAPPRISPPPESLSPASAPRSTCAP